MKKIYLFLFIFYSFHFAVQAQIPGVRWSRVIRSGVGAEVFYDIKRTPANSYVAVGAKAFFYDTHWALNKRINGQYFWAFIDSSGNLTGSGSHAVNSQSAFTAVEIKPDSGNIMAGYMEGTLVGDTADIYMIHRLPNSTFAWQRKFGGSKEDVAMDMIANSSGGYTLAGYTKSNDGNVSGNHGVNTADVWLLKTDGVGNLLWQKCFGGSAGDTAFALIETPDKGFVVVGSSASSNGNLTGNNGAADAWVLKTDSLGNILWQKNFGGSAADAFRDVVLNADSSFTITGYTRSAAATSNGNKGMADVWLIRIDQNRNTIWSKGFGGSQDEAGFSLLKTHDNSFIVSGFTNSNNADVSGNNGQADSWTIKVSDNGNLAWQKCAGTTANDISMANVYLNEHEFTLGGFTEPSAIPNDPADGYFLRLGSTANFIGNISAPFNFSGGMVQLTKPGVQYSTIPSNSRFFMDIDTGNYVGVFNSPNPNYTINPSSFNVNFPNYYDTIVQQFIVAAIPGRRDLTISALPLNVARPGFSLQYKILYKNAGTDTVANGIVMLKKDSRLNFLSSTPSPSSVSGDTLKWNYSNFRPLDTASINVNLQVQPPPAVNINDTITSLAIIDPVAGDLAPADDTALIRQRVIGSYDPNDKTENLGGIISPQQLAAGSYINYLIRFQNTGTDTAFNITIRDTLDNKLDWASLQMISASHAYQLQIASQNRLAWEFANIDLPDSNRNEPASHGFIAYRVKPRNNLVMGDNITNTASIYFDYNLPVRTNTQVTTVANTIITGINDPVINQSAMLLFPNPSADQLWIRINENVRGNAILQVRDLSGRLILLENLGRVDLNSYQKSLNLSRIPAGSYIISLQSGKNIYVQKLVLQ